MPGKPELAKGLGSGTKIDLLRAGMLAVCTHVHCGPLEGGLCVCLCVLRGVVWQQSNLRAATLCGAVREQCCVEQFGSNVVWNSLLGQRGHKPTNPAACSYFVHYIFASSCSTTSE